MRDAGAPSHLIEALEQEQHECNLFDVDETEQEIIALFLRVQDQWRVVAGFGGEHYQGLDLNVALNLVSLLKKEKGQALIDELIIISQAAARKMNEILAERAKKKKT